MNFSKLHVFKRPSALSSSSEFSESDMMNVCEDSNDSLVEEEPKNLAKDLEAKFSTNELKANDYVLVQFQRKRNVKYYVAHVVEIQDKHLGTFIVKYLKKSLDSNKFKIEIDAKLNEDIILRLPNPVTVCGTERRENKFHVSFAGFHLG